MEEIKNQSQSFENGKKGNTVEIITLNSKIEKLKSEQAKRNETKTLETELDISYSLVLFSCVYLHHSMFRKYIQPYEDFIQIRS